MSLSFQVNEKVLCYHGPLLYEAKVLRNALWDETNTKTEFVGPHYYVHYKGWKQTWDEWVPMQRLLKWNEQNLAMQKSLVSNAAAAQASSIISTGKSAKSASAKDPRGSGIGGSRKEGTRGTKRGREEDDGTRKPELKLALPDVLKLRLVDDWEAVTKNNQIVTLPREPTVQELLQQFKDHVLASPNHPQDASVILPTVISGLQLYFDKALGSNLLYRFERPQYAQMRKKYITGQDVIIGNEKEMSQVYGAEHLLRLIVSLPAMVAKSTMDPESVNILKDYVHELLNYMVQERHRIFMDQYEAASTQYINVARS